MFLRLTSEIYTWIECLSTSGLYLWQVINGLPVEQAVELLSSCVVDEESLDQMKLVIWWAPGRWSLLDERWEEIQREKKQAYLRGE